MDDLYRNGNANLSEVGQVGESNTTSELHPTELSATVKAALPKGADVRLIKFEPEPRSQVIGIIAALRDELPVICRWVTIRESHLSETRLRAKSYLIKGEYLHTMIKTTIKRLIVTLAIRSLLPSCTSQWLINTFRLLGV